MIGKYFISLDGERIVALSLGAPANHRVGNRNSSVLCVQSSLFSSSVLQLATE